MQRDIDTAPGKPNYGIDAPGHVRNLIVFGTIAIVLGPTLSAVGANPDLAAAWAGSGSPGDCRSSSGRRS